MKTKTYIGDMKTATKMQKLKTCHRGLHITWNTGSTKLSLFSSDGVQDSRWWNWHACWCI